jgi:hypothetical protein
MKTIYLFICLFFAPLDVGAAYYELGFSGNYRKLYLPSDTNREAFDATVAYTASIAYYFAEMAAVELNYTKGQSERYVPSPIADSRTLYDFSLIGLDLIFSFADRSAPFVPYVKAGVAYFANKDVTYEFIDNNNSLNNRRDQLNLGTAFVPSLGFGMRFRLTQTMAIKLGMEAWSSDSIERRPTWDVAGRAGISWFF